MNTSIDSTYTEGKLLLSIIQEGISESLVAALRDGGAQGGTILLADGVAKSSLLHLLGIGDTKKEIVLTILSQNLVEPVTTALQNFRREKRLPCGIALLIDVKHILHHNNGDALFKMLAAQNQSEESIHSPKTLITCIVNKGNAEDLMQAAKKAGARGGTIIAGRGTGKEEDVKLFGFQIVPEKEILLIVVDSVVIKSVCDAIRKVSDIIQPGSAIAFCIDVEHLIALGSTLPIVG